MSHKHKHKKDFSKSFEEELKVELHSRSNQRSGLCADCVRSESCILSQNIESTIWNCEDYQNEEISPVSAPGRTEESEGMGVQASTSAESNQGLCPFCIHRDICSLKHEEGGIWHCEDYE